MAVPLRVVASGTVTQANMKISAVDGGATASGGAFIDLLATTFESSKSVLGPTAIAAGAALLDTTTANAFIGGGPDLTAYQTGNYKIRLRNTASQAVAEAWISATAPSGYDAPTEMLDDPIMNNAAKWTTTTWTVSGGKATTAGGATLLQIKTRTSGSLYVASLDVDSRTAGSVGLYDHPSAPTFIIPLASTTGTRTGYRTFTQATGEWFIGISGASTFAGVVDNASYKNVTMPTSAGALLLSTKSGSRGYLRKDAAFDPNAAMTIEVFSANPLPQHIGHLVRIKDSSNRVIQGYIKAAGAGETAVTDVLAGWDLTSGWTSSANAVIDDLNSFHTTAGSHSVSKNSNPFTTAALYKVTTNMTIGGGAYYIRVSGTTAISGDNTNKYYTAVGAGWAVMLASATTCDITTMTAYRVTAPSNTGVTIVSTKGGATYNFAQKNSAFNYNDASGYTYEILKTPAVVVASGSITAGAALLDTTTDNAFYGGGVDLTAYQDGRHAIAFYQATGMAWGWISATAPSGESLTTVSSYTTWDGATGATVPTGWTQAVAGRWDVVDSGDGAPYSQCLRITVNATPNAQPRIFKNNTVNIGNYYRVSGFFKHGTGADGGRIAVGSTQAGNDYGINSLLTDATWTAKTISFTAKTTMASVTLQNLAVVAGQTEYWDEVILKSLDMPASTGALLLSTKSGSRGYINKDTGFDPNAAMTYKVYLAD
jgi:hypothetical protein